MSYLNDMHWRLIAGKPNAQGLCTFCILDANNAEIATLDTPCTLDEALGAAERFAKQELQAQENE